MDYCKLNEHVNSYTANADVCAQTMREWRQQGPKAAIVDLRRAYLQTGRMRELEEGWNGRDSPWRSSLPNLNRLRSQSICYLREGERLLSYSQITPRPLAERRSLNSPSAGCSDEIPMCIRAGWQRDCGEISPHNKTHCHKNTVLGDGGCILVQCDSQR